MTQNETIRINIDIDDRDLRNLNDTISSLEQTLNDLNGSLSSTVNEFSLLDAGSSIVNGTFDTLLRTLSLSTMSLGNVTENLKFLTGTTTIFKNATTGAEVAMNKKTTAMGLATGAAIGLKFAMKAIPFVGLITIAFSLINTLARLSRSTNETSDATDDFAKNLEQLKERLARNREAHESNVRSIGAQGRATENLIKEILTLNNFAAECILTQDRLRLATDLLNASTDEFGVVIDGVTGMLDANSKAALEAAHEQNVLNTAYGEQEIRLLALWDAQIDQEYALLRMDEAYGKLQHRLEDYRSELEELITAGAHAIMSCKEKTERFQYLADTLGMTKGELIQLDLAQSDYLFTVEETSLNVYELCDTLEYWQIMLTDSQERIGDLEDQLIESFSNMEDATVESITNQIIAFDDLSRAQQDVVNELSRTFNSHVDQLRGANGKIRENNEFTADHWRTTMLHNQRVMSEWADSVDSLTGRISDEMMDYIRSLGPEHAHLVAELVAMSCDELAEMESVFRNNCQVAGYAALAGLDYANIPKEVANLIFESEQSVSAAIRDADFEGLGLNLAEGLRDGIKDGEILVGTGAAELLREAEKAAREASETNSPSQVFDRIGKDLVNGLVQGLESLQERPVTQLQTIARNMQRVYNNANREYSNIGRQIMTGLNQGLLNGENTVMATARRIANNIARTMQDALAINSPSRVMREQIGRHIPSGVAAGIEKYAGIAIDSVDKLASDMVKITIPSVESMIGMRPNLSFAGAGGIGGSSQANRTVNHNYDRLFEGANIHWHNEADIRRTMEKMALVAEEDTARMW